MDDGFHAGALHETADRERLGREAAHMLENDERTSIPAPRGEVRAVGEKD